jgi:hypothetical protein
MKKGFKMYKDTYAAISYGNLGYIIIHNGQQLEKSYQYFTHYSNEWCWGGLTIFFLGYNK